MTSACETSVYAVYKFLPLKANISHKVESGDVFICFPILFEENYSPCFLVLHKYFKYGHETSLGMIYHVLTSRFRFISSPWIIIHDIGQVNYYTITHYNKKVRLHFSSLWILIHGIGGVKYCTIVDYHKNKDTSNIGNSTAHTTPQHTSEHQFLSLCETPWYPRSLSGSLFRHTSKICCLHCCRRNIKICEVGSHKTCTDVESISLTIHELCDTVD
jgi:hypothetical protein